MTRPGVATIDGGVLGRRRAEGKLVNLERRLKSEPLDGTIGIGHTRWATHGVPNETNAHPHFSDGVAIVHNGIIENFSELREELQRDGYVFASQTDTEVVAHLVARELARGVKPVEAAHNALKRLQGAFALAIMFTGDDDLIVGARNGPPLAVGHGEGEMFLGSDAIALAPIHQLDHLSRGWRLGGCPPQRDRHLRHGRQQGRAQAPAVARHLLHGRQGQPPALHGEGDP